MNDCKYNKCKNLYAEWEKIVYFCYKKGVFDYNLKITTRFKISECLNKLCDNYSSIYIPTNFLRDSNEAFAIKEELINYDNREKIIIADRPHYSNLFSKLLNEIFISRRNIYPDFILHIELNVLLRTRLLLFIRKIVNRCKGECLCDSLNKLGLLTDVGERNWKYCGLEVTYADIYNHIKAYECAISQDEKEIAAKSVFGAFLFIKDFVNAEKWKETILSFENVETNIIYNEIWEKIQVLLEDIKESIKFKEHIVLNWIDDLRYNELDQMPLLKTRLDRNGLFFSNMYAQTPYTWGTMRAILTGKKLIDDKTYVFFNDENADECYEKSALLHSLKERGYDFEIISTHFKGKYINKRHKSREGLTYLTPQPVTVTQFDSICELAGSEKKLFLIIHNFYETHPRYLNPLHNTRNDLSGSNGWEDGCREKTMQQLKESKGYFDEELDYYSRFYDTVKYNIFMSDHGEIRWEEGFRIEELYHVLFSVVSKETGKKIIDDVCTLTDFTEIICDLLDTKDCFFSSLKNRKYISIQSDDVYSFGGRMNNVRQGITKNITELIQSRGVVTKDDAFVKLVVGWEYYYRNKDNDTNLIDDEKYQERIKELRLLSGNRFIDIFKEEKYTPARELYELLQLERDDSIEYL